jgi:hypothetical protein
MGVPFCAESVENQTEVETIVDCQEVGDILANQSVGSSRFRNPEHLEEQT